MNHIAVGDIRYNPVTAAYEARVDIDKKGRTYRYPCSISGSMTMDEDMIRRNLTRQALRLAQRDGGLFAIR